MEICMHAASGVFLVTILLGLLFIYSESLAPVIIAHSLASIGFGWMITFRSYACADKSFASHLHAETQPSIPVSYAGYVSTRTDLLRAEQATANVYAYMLMEIRRKTILW